MNRSSFCIGVLSFLLLLHFQEAMAAGQGRRTIGLPLDPRIQSMIAAVSSDTMISNLSTLVGFHTRHTNSDTVSNTIGIGAARRWVYSQFLSYATNPSTVELLPSYFTFSASVCGLTGEHRNIVATLPGTETPERNFIVMGHIDSRNVDNCDNSGYAPGANDDGSGTAVAMEMARVMGAYALESTLILMPVTGEEQGLVGSEAFADFAIQQGMRIDGVLTNDIVSNIEGCVDPTCPPGEPVLVDSMSVRHFSGTPDNGISRQLSRYMKLQGARYRPEMLVNLVAALDRPGRGGDHIPFYDRGFAAVRFTEPHESGDGSGGNGRQHNMEDTISSINTNKGYMAEVAKLSIAGFASLALGPATPEGLQAFDVGDGESISLLWPLVQTEPDFSGYMVAERNPDSLYYEAFYDPGMANQITVGGLVTDEERYFSLAAYDSAGNLSLFSVEVGITPSTLPRMVQNLGSTSRSSDVELSWDPAVELDVTRYRVYRSANRYSGFLLYDSVAVPLTEYVDAAISPHVLYFYQVTSVDVDGNESPASEVVAGRQVTHDLGILVVDDTRDGAGTVLFPTDAQVDDYYAGLLGGFIIGGHFDAADSASFNFGISDADMAAYSTVFWHSDVRGSEPMYQDTSALRKYLQQGGRLLVSGWKLSSSLQLGATIGFNAYPAGTFVPEFLQVDSTYTSGSFIQDFRSAIAALPEYPDVEVDSAKIPLYDGTLVNTDAVLPPFADPAVEVLYTHHGKVAGSRLEGNPVGWRFTGGAVNLVVFDFPIYYMESSTGGEALRQALIDLGELTPTDPDYPPPIPLSHRLYQNYPNPFNPTTEIRFDLPLPSQIRITIYNLLGQEIRTVANEKWEAGSHAVTWDGRRNDGSVVASGLYVYRIQAGPLGTRLTGRRLPMGLSTQRVVDDSSSGQSGSFSDSKKMMVIR